MRKEKTYFCKCCKKEVSAKKLGRTISVLPHDGFIKHSNQNVTDSFLFQLEKGRGNYQWTCDNCLESKSALLANPRKQFYQFKSPMESTYPFLAYYDKSFTCKNCNKDFSFSKEEQQTWYEEYKFIVYSKPNHCKEGRKEIRHFKQLNTKLSELLIDGMPEDLGALEEIKDIYKEMNLVEKQKKIEAVIRKKGK